MRVMLPPSRPSRPARIRNSVVLPVPLAPTMPTRSLGVTSQSKSSNRTLGPNLLAAPVSWIIGNWRRTRRASDRRERESASTVVGVVAGEGRGHAAALVHFLEAGFGGVIGAGGQAFGEPEEMIPGAGTAVERLQNSDLVS